MVLHCPQSIPCLKNPGETGRCSAVLAFSRRPACSSLEKLQSSADRLLRWQADCLAEYGAEEMDNDVILKLKHSLKASGSGQILLTFLRKAFCSSGVISV